MSSSLQGQNQGFFDIQINQEFVEQLDDNTFSQLYDILKQNFYNEYNQYTKEKEKLEQTETEIKIGEDNLKTLSKIQDEHQTQNQKYKASIDLLNEEISKLKDQWKSL